MASVREPETPVLVEPAPIPDVFVEGIARIERLAGANFRFVLYATQQDTEGRPERVIVLKFVASLAIIPAMIRQVSAVVTAVSEIIGLMH